MKLLKYIVIIERNIAIGAKQNLFIFWRKYTLSRVYGIIKYNANLLKYISISKINVTKCVFDFLSKLNKCQIEVDVIINLIQGLLPYTSFRGITSTK